MTLAEVRRRARKAAALTSGDPALYRAACQAFTDAALEAGLSFADITAELARAATATVVRRTAPPPALLAAQRAHARARSGGRRKRKR